MATGSQTLQSLRGRIEASEAAGGTPLRFLYPAQGSVALTVANEPIKVDLAWNKQDLTYDILAGIETDGVALTGIPLSYEDALWYASMFDAALSGTPSTTDTSAYTRTGAPSQTDNTVSATGVRSCLLQYSSSDFISTAGWSIPGLIGESMTLNFKKRASGNDTGVSGDFTFMTASKATVITAFTGSLSDRTQTYPTGNALKSYVDTTTSGSTADANITDATFTLQKQNKYHDGMDLSNAHTSMHRPVGWTSQLTFTRKFSDLTEYNAYLGAAGIKTLRRVRITATGAIVGAVSAVNTLQLDFSGKHTAMSAVPQYVDGVLYQNFTLDGVMDTTLGASWKLTGINNVSTAYTAL